MWEQDERRSWTGVPRWGGGANSVKKTGLYPERNGQPGRL